MNKKTFSDIPSFRDFGIPFTVRTSPHWSTVQNATRDWAESHGMFRDEKTKHKFNNLAYARLVAKACPDASIEELTQLARWITFFFVLDDQQDNAVFTNRVADFLELQSRIIDTLMSEGERHSGAQSPLLSALSDLCRRTANMVSREYYIRLTVNIKDALSGQKAEILYRKSRALPTVRDFIAVRRYASTVHANLTLIEACAKVYVPDEIYHMPAFQEMILSVADITCWCNDVWSAERDHANHDPINYVSVLRGTGLDSNQATRKTVEAVGRRIRDNIQSKENLLRTMQDMRVPEEVVSSCLAAVQLGRNWIAGTAQWYWDETTRLLQHAEAAPGTNPDFVSDLL
ncbi:terpene synthase family protein [Streptomyces cinereoruber]|uniref:terpene synthase family protein n=1 Tax=Streptomyces cinereoruber TaxID=67260 RepID=UPI00362A06ED